MNHGFKQVTVVAATTLLCVTLAQAAARKNAAAKPTAQRASDTIATHLEIKGTPDTDIQTTPSVSPIRESEGAPAWEGSAPLTAPDDELQPDANVRETAHSLSAGTAAYMIDWYSINSGGVTAAASSSYRMGASVGQSVAGEATSANYRIGIGFWYGAGGIGCTCPCWADPQCDGVRSNVQDVVGTINVAFRGAAGVIDPGCSFERTDVNASGFTNVQDVVAVVNVAFRGAFASTTYVDPCLQATL